MHQRPVKDVARDISMSYRNHKIAGPAENFYLKNDLQMRWLGMD
jgi:hypothetical protein